MKMTAGAWTSKLWMGAVFLFLYLPIVTLIILSFNASPMVTTWGGWSLRWYQELVHDTEIINGFMLSLQIAFLTACSSVILGTLAALFRNIQNTTAVWVQHTRARGSLIKRKKLK